MRQDFPSLFPPRKNSINFHINLQFTTMQKNGGKGATFRYLMNIDRMKVLSILPNMCRVALLFLLFVVPTQSG